MVETIRKALIDWNASTTDRQKLQHSYVVLLLVMTFIAGMVALFNGERSRQVMYVSLALIITFVVNFVAWSLLKTILLDKLPKTSRKR